MTTDDGWIMMAVAQYERPLLAYVQRLLGDAERSRDVVQDAFLQLCRQDRRSVEPRLAAWLYTVSRRRVIDITRKEQRMTADLALLSTSASREAAPDASLEQEDQTQAVLRSLDGLPGNQREALVLKFQQQFSYKEIAEIMDLSVSHVGVLLHQGLKTLRNKLGHLS